MIIIVIIILVSFTKHISFLLYLHNNHLKEVSSDLALKFRTRCRKKQYQWKDKILNYNYSSLSALAFLLPYYKFLLLPLTYLPPHLFFEFMGQQSMYIHLDQIGISMLDINLSSDLDE